jgi:ABC-type sugar transport system ATPase subunit
MMAPAARAEPEPDRSGSGDLLIAEGVSKRFGVTQALDDVSVRFRAGEVHALMGENGAGKSTLGKVIAGLHAPDKGTVTIGGRALKPGSIDDAFSAGVRIVHQELAQCPNLSVAENLCLHAMPSRYGLADFRAMNERAAELLSELEPGIDPMAPLGLLSPGHRQIVQIAASLDSESGHGDDEVGPARVIVFDEPTSSLSLAETERLLTIVRQLARQGLTIIYVSHRMGEIFQCCDRVTVLRDGKFVATGDIAETSETDLVEWMVGRRIETTSARTPGGEAAALMSLDGEVAERKPVGEAKLLEVSGLSSPKKLQDISLHVREGEVVGIGGLVGAGRSELLDAIFGLDPRAKGRVTVGGRPLRGGSPQASIAAGVGYVPEDRKLQGLFFELGVDENIVMPVMARLAHRGLRALGAERSLVGESLVKFQVKAASTAALPGSLSGGNQQKLLIARWMRRGVRVLLLDEPTRGIDVGTKAEIYQRIREAADSGVAVLLVSSEMPELLALSDRVLVMCGGRITGELTGDGMTQEGILRLATVE